MRDSFKRARAGARYARFTVKNGSARAKVKAETRKALKAN